MTNAADQVPSYAAVRRALGDAMRPMRAAVYRDHAPEPVECMGYRWTCERQYNRGYGLAWKYAYRGEPCDDATRARWPMGGGHIAGGVEDCATALYERLRTVEAERGGRPWHTVKEKTPGA